LAVAIANGTITVYKWQDPTELMSYETLLNINVVPDYGECTCLSWNQAFDEPMSIAVGCMIKW